MFENETLSDSALVSLCVLRDKSSVSGSRSTRGLSTDGVNFLLWLRRCFHIFQRRIIVQLFKKGSVIPWIVWTLQTLANTSRLRIQIVGLSQLITELFKPAAISFCNRFHSPSGWNQQRCHILTRFLLVFQSFDDACKVKACERTSIL